MSIGTNTKFPENITISEVLKVPDGNVFKFALYGIGTIEYKFNGSDSTWIPFISDALLFNDPKDVSFNPSSIVATFSGVAVDQFGKQLEGTIKSVLPGDMSSFSAKAVGADLDPNLKTLRGTLGQITANEGTTFSDIIYCQIIFNATDPPAGSHPNGYICRLPLTATHLYYKSA